MQPLFGKPLYELQIIFVIIVPLLYFIARRKFFQTEVQNYIIDQAAKTNTMQSKIFSIALFIICFIKNSEAQVNLLPANEKTDQNTIINSEETLNLIKINVTSLPLKNLSVQYEKVLSKTVSVAVSFRYMPMSAIPFKGLLKNAVGDNQDAQDIINKSRISNFAATPEVRFYLGKGYGEGFYIAPYYRYVRFSTNTVTVNYTASTGPKRSVELSGDLTANTGGLMVGAQWFLGSHFSLDWWIAGAHYGSGSGNFNGVPGIPLTIGEQNEIRQNLEDIDIPLTEKTVSVTANNVAVKFDGPFGGFRAGILIGIRF